MSTVTLWYTATTLLCIGAICQEKGVTAQRATWPEKARIVAGLTSMIFATAMGLHAIGAAIAGAR